MNLTMALNAAACGCLFWIAGSFLLAHPPAKGTRALILQLGLLLTMVGSMVGALAPYRYDAEPSWWALALRIGAAITAVCVYDELFGIVTQTRNTTRHLLTTPQRIRAWWRRALSTAEQARRCRPR